MSPRSHQTLSSRGRVKEEFTPLLRAAMEKGCTVQVGTDMLFEMIPAYLEFFGFGTSTPEELRRVATVKY